MLNWALIFLIVALVAAVFGFTGLAVAAAGAAKILFFLFLVLFLISLAELNFSTTLASAGLLKVLDVPLMPLRRFPARECSKVPPLVGLGVYLFRI
jgi:uncharacterized membrane protein YtjA (UPF0391 family)